MQKHTEYLVLYEEPRFVMALDQQTHYDNEGHALVVPAETEAQAFVVAFDMLTRRGHMVRTIKAGETRDTLQRSQQEQRTYDPHVHIIVIAGLTLEQMEHVWNAGVPLIGGRGDTRKMTNIINIQPYNIRAT
jgi:hypothetical protein